MTNPKLPAAVRGRRLGINVRRSWPPRLRRTRNH